MLIGVNEKDEIIQINTITDSSLVQKEVDRDVLFPGFSDFRILHYRYIENESGGHCILPLMDPKDIDKLEMQNQLQILGQQITNIMLGG